MRGIVYVEPYQLASKVTEQNVCLYGIGLVDKIYARNMLC